MCISICMELKMEHFRKSYLKKILATLRIGEDGFLLVMIWQLAVGYDRYFVE